MLHESNESISRTVSAQLYAARKAGRTPESIRTSPQTYHRLLVAFMHHVSTSSRGVELFGIPLVIDQEIAEIDVSLG
ncbi:MAG: hypothetical protein JW764_10475 [Chlorobiaceae bacterium]|nr:hypothetical protein [Chlorobiaceae bacterium]